MSKPYEGPHQELHLILAGPDWMARWGLNRPLLVGERIEGVKRAIEEDVIQAHLSEVRGCLKVARIA